MTRELYGPEQSTGRKRIFANFEGQTTFLMALICGLLYLADGQIEAEVETDADFTDAETDTNSNPNPRPPSTDGPICRCLEFVSVS